MKDITLKPFNISPYAEYIMAKNHPKLAHRSS